VEAVGHDGQFGDRPLQTEHVKHAEPAQHGQPIQCVAPEVLTVGECVKQFPKEPGFGSRMLLPERGLQLLHKIAKPDRVLLIIGMAPMGRLIEQGARRLMT
jgi:hypothetical protein